MNSNETERDLRERAVKSLKKKREFYAHLFTYVIINSLIVVIWATVGQGGFFWPMFPIVFWGIGLLMNAWDVYVSHDISERDIDREISRMHRQ